jgi:hypothetical protein
MCNEMDMKIMLRDLGWMEVAPKIYFLIICVVSPIILVLSSWISFFCIRYTKVTWIVGCIFLRRINHFISRLFSLIVGVFLAFLLSSLIIS